MLSDQRRKARIYLKENATLEDRQVIFDLLEVYNSEQVGSETELPLAVTILDDTDEKIIGGLWGLTYYQWLFVELLVVPADMRGRGIGTELMRLAETEATRRGCHGVWVDTFSFQAYSFYKKLGYTSFGVIPDYPPNHKRFFLLKRIPSTVTKGNTDVDISRLDTSGQPESETLRGEPIRHCKPLSLKQEMGIHAYPSALNSSQKERLVQAKFRKLGNTGFDVSTVGFGTWQIGGGRWKSDSPDRCIKLLRKARDLGVNIFDAAVVYGQYRDTQQHLQSRSQEILGEAFECHREGVIYCVKVGQFDEYSHRALFDATRIVEHVTQSMRRLRTDYLDICLIHAPSISDVRRGTAIEILRTLQALGMIRAIGYSFEAEPDHVRAALDQRVDVIMLQYNLIDTQCDSVLKLAQDHGVGVLVGGPYKRGYLSGQFTQIADLPQEDDYWRWNLAYNEGKVVHTLARVKELMQDYDKVCEFRRHALQFVLEGAGVASAVIGHRSIEEIRENLSHADY